MQARKEKKNITENEALRVVHNEIVRAKYVFNVI